MQLKMGDEFRSPGKTPRPSSRKKIATRETPRVAATDGQNPGWPTSFE
jgi:hypothetical protein